MTYPHVVILEAADCGHHACEGERACIYPPGLLTTPGEDS